MGMKTWLLESLPIVAMVVIQILDVGLTTISKAAMSKGMSRFVFVVYSNALATLILLPYALIFERKRRPPLTFSLLCKFFLLSLCGISLMQNCVFTGVNYSSPTLASALSNLIPAFTFLLAIIFRMENLDLKNSKFQIKILGTLVSISGALIIIFYKGPTIGTLPDSSTENGHPLKPSYSTMLATTNNWVIGGIFLVIAGLSNSVSIISQAAILKNYPSEMTVVSFYCLFGTIQCGAFSLAVERDPNAWRLTPDVQLASVFYSAIAGSVLTFSVQMWCIQKKGPLFVAMFTPLGIAVAALMSGIFLGDSLHVGSVIGAVIIVIGFYGVMWAQKNREKSVTHEVDRQQSSSLQKTPLLASQTPV
ncbi:WAT1-related protein At4g15540 [Ziziphus jujuba]|uniref:WAT1-related protein n=2 Tax=Ziziphus jujuba TaxID=326968 RepID=A0A6P4AAB5_ZIZJJ|nr:WAT1-related protein At4g15540 [Ziziphus jujuba]KAH7528499.1 hypothetical protein FEM48_Zijuj05G0078600 [Ziziphus jujuba var. spinosa]